MLNKQHNSIITLALLLTLVGTGTPKPAKASLLAQVNSAPASFSLPDQLPQDTKVRIAGSNSTAGMNESLKESFESQYPKAEVNLETQNTEEALTKLSNGEADLAAIGRNLTAEEKQQGFVAVPFSREKIAIIVTKDNSFDGNLTIDQFARIFRGEITDWSEIGGSPGKIELVDLPDTNDTRQAFPSYPVFQGKEFTTGDNAIKIEEDNTEAIIDKLGSNGISFAVANDVLNRDELRAITMHQTQPDDPRYPFSQPFSFVYKGTPSPEAKAFLGFATASPGQEIIKSRVGSVSTLVAAGNLARGNSATTTPDAVGDGGTNSATTTPDAVGDGGTNSATTTPDAVGDGGTNSATTTPDAVGDGGTNSATTTPDAVGDGGTNSATTTPDAVGDGGTNSATTTPDAVGDGGTNSATTTPETTTGTSSGSNVVPDDNNADAIANKDGKKWLWWLLLLPLIPLAWWLFGRSSKSDQEPAVDNFPEQPIGTVTTSPIPPTSDGGIPLDAQGNNVVNQVSSSATSATSKIGGTTLAAGAALAGGAAAASRFVNRTQEDTETDEPRLDFTEPTNDDLSENLEPITIDEDNNNLVDVGNPVIETPDNRINDYSESTTIPSTEVMGDFNDTPSNLIDRISETGSGAWLGGTAIAGGAAAAAANFLNDDEESSTDNDWSDVDRKIPEAPITEDGVQNSVDNFTEQPTKLQTIDLSEEISDTVTSTEDEVTNFVEGTKITSSAIDEDSSGTIDLGYNFASEPATEEYTFDGVDGEVTTPFVEDATNLETTEEYTFDGVDGEVTTPSVEDATNLETTEEYTFDGVDGEVTTPSVEDAANLETTEEYTFDGVDGEVTTPSVEDAASDEVSLETTETIQENINITNDISESENNLIREVTEFSEDTRDSATNSFDSTSAITGAAIIGGAAAATSGFFSNAKEEAENLDESTTDLVSDSLTSSEEIGHNFNTGLNEITLEQEELIERASNTSNNLNLDTSFDEMTFDDSDIDLDEITLDDADELSASLDDITFDDYDDSDINLDEITLDDSDDVIASLDEITFDDSDNVVTSLDEITFDDSDDVIASLDELVLDEDENSDANLDRITFDDSNGVIASLDEIALDESYNSDSNFDEIIFDNSDGLLASLDEIALDESYNSDSDFDEIIFDDSTENETTDLIGDVEEKSNKLTEDKASNDSNDISEWLENLETSSNKSNNISEWLNNLDTTNVVESKRLDYDESNQSKKENNDEISFQFLEDLLEQDASTNQDDK
jgi:phosphate transport system substrate-binding protein